MRSPYELADSDDDDEMPALRESTIAAIQSQSPKGALIDTG